MGIIIGFLGIYLFNINGFYIGNMGITGMLVTNTIRAKPELNSIVNVIIMTFVVTLLAGLYPAVMASRMQPVEALRAEK